MASKTNHSKTQRPAHGGLQPSEMRALGLRPQDILDFSCNVNPLGTSEMVRQAACRADFSAYPDPDCLVLREKLAAVNGVGTEQVVPGNGSTELIYCITRAYLHSGDRGMILAPTFGEYAAGINLTGAEAISISASIVPDFKWDIQNICADIRRQKPNLVFLCNPNNPTGAYLERSALEDISKAAGSGILVIDEAYISFVNNAWDSTALLEHGNIIILRSMTKEFALPGLRLGYCLCPPGRSDDVARFIPSWSVNAAAQAAGIAALAETDYVAKAREVITHGRERLTQDLSGLGYRVVPSKANFILVKVGNGARFRSLLLQKGCCVRDCASFGLPEYVRIAVLLPAQCDTLIQAIHTIVM